MAPFMLILDQTYETVSVFSPGQTIASSTINIDFAGNANVTNIFKSPALLSTKTHTLYVYGFYMDSQCGQGYPPCPPWVANIGSPAQGTHSLTFYSPMNNGYWNAGTPIVWQFVQN